MTSYNKSSKYVPTYSLNTPNTGPQQPVHITKNSPVYSSYTSKFIQYGPILKGTPNMLQ